MARVIGVGGVFFKARDPEALRQWYLKHLEIDVQVWGGATFEQRDHGPGSTSTPFAWRIAASDDESFAPSSASFMIDYLVADLSGLLQTLRAEGCEVVGEFDEGELGLFGWVIDPEGNKIELWEPVQTTAHGSA